MDKVSCLVWWVRKANSVPKHLVWCVFVFFWLEQERGKVVTVNIQVIFRQRVVQPKKGFPTQITKITLGHLVCEAVFVM